MQNALFLASIFGPYLFFMGLWMVVCTKNVSKVFTSVRGSGAAVTLCGFLKMLIGLTAINIYNMWVWDITLLVTLFGWVFFIRGLLSLFMPKAADMFAVKKDKHIKLMGLIPLVWGVLLCWLAFFM